ncbi:hypothetical protein V493_05571 [Pseudogymnoascus sp. VKM F-4281 (FW-2241)]|nr:hypothetical protein V493_05571 [Pseudogymnoascus sp. VKM F-4281 (FW-2241)]
MKWSDTIGFTTDLEEDSEGDHVPKHVLNRNPEFAGAIDVIRQGKIPIEADFTTEDHSLSNIFKAFPLLLGLVRTYVAIDRLSSTETSNSDCFKPVGAIRYIIRFDRKLVHRGRFHDTIQSWEDYMSYIEKLVYLAPDFARWDKHTKEIEILADEAIAASINVLGEHIPPKENLPQPVVAGIYARIELLRRWKESSLEKVRARDDYKTWKMQQGVPPQSSQLRNRRGYPIDSAATTVPSAAVSTPLETPKPYKRPSKPQAAGQYLQGDLTIWSLNLFIFLSSAILQAISFSQPALPTPPPPDFLAAIQSTLTQLLAVLMTYILTIRHDSTSHLSTAYRIWFCLAYILPLVALGIFRWYDGMSALLTFLGTAVTGFLQVLLAVEMKRGKGLP